MPLRVRHLVDEVVVSDDGYCYHTILVTRHSFKLNVTTVCHAVAT